MKKNYFSSAVMAVVLCIVLVTISCKKDGNEQEEDLSKYKQSYLSVFQYTEKDNNVARYWLCVSTAKYDSKSGKFLSEGETINFILNSEAPKGTEAVRPAAGTYILSSDQKKFTIDNRDYEYALVIAKGSGFEYSETGVEDFTEAVIEVEHEGTTKFKILAKFKIKSGKSICVTAKDFDHVIQGSNEGDVAMDLTAPEATGIFYGDYYGQSKGYWRITINDTEELTIGLSVASPTSTTIPTGTFKMSVFSNVDHFTPGSLQAASKAPSPTYWIRKSPKATVLITGGTITITHLSGKNYTITANACDMFGNRLTGSWTGPLIFVDKSNKTRAVLSK